MICCKFMIEDVFVINGYIRNGKEVSSCFVSAFPHCRSYRSL